MLRIETDRLILRDFHPDDRDAYIHITRDPRYQRCYSEADCSEERSAQLVNEFVASSAITPRSMFQLAIVERSTQELIGTCGLRLQGDRQASMGCGLDVTRQGQGFAREAVEALLGWGFESFDIHRVFAETLSDNRAAVELCERIGMRREAHFREHRFFRGRWWDGVVYALLRSEWSGRSG